MTRTDARTYPRVVNGQIIVVTANLSESWQMEPIRRVWLKAFWGLDPANEGYLGFTRPGDQERFIAEGRTGDLVLIYGAASEHTVLTDRHRVLGFLEVELVPIRDVDRMSPTGRDRKVSNGWHNRWTYAVPVRRAWKVEREIEVRHIAPETYTSQRARVIASRGELLTPSDTERALALPVSPLNVFGEPPITNSSAPPSTIAEVFRPSRGVTPSFGKREAEYEDGEHYLYILKAEGCVPALLGREPHQLAGRSLVKVGFSNHPDRRCNEHNSTLPPASKFKWRLVVKSRAYPDGQAAKVGEDNLKMVFENHFESLGGEFFLGSGLIFSARK
ncbi:MAG: GIY-YIG nuclease family protein [Acetobacteraceae bacterium]|nr:GIY-YIG nuclease family protein [Acetobacteraceae bacterium]